MKLNTIDLAELEELISQSEVVAAKAVRKAIKRLTYDIQSHGVQMVAAGPAQSPAGPPEPPPFGVLQNVYAYWSEIVLELLSPLITNAWNKGVSATVQSVHSVTPEWDPPVINYLQLERLEKATQHMGSLATEIWQHAQNEIILGVESGDSMHQMAQRVATVADLSIPRAQTIVRTEVISSANAGTFDLIELAGFTGKQEWLATNDPKTRKTHRDADGQKVEIGAMFDVGIWQAHFPGAATLPPGERFNCRCTVAYDVDEDDLVAALTAAGKWDSAKHPRDSKGKFVKKNLLGILKHNATESEIDSAIDDLSPEEWNDLTPAQKEAIDNEIALSGSEAGWDKFSAMKHKAANLAKTAKADTGPSTTTNVGPPLKITHKDIHLPKKSGEILAVSKDGKTTIVWNETQKKYAIIAPGANTTLLPKSKVYDFMQGSDWNSPAKATSSDTSSDLDAPDPITTSTDPNLGSIAGKELAEHPDGDYIAVNEAGTGIDVIAADGEVVDTISAEQFTKQNLEGDGWKILGEGVKLKFKMFQKQANKKIAGKKVGKKTAGAMKSVAPISVIMSDKFSTGVPSTVKNFTNFKKTGGQGGSNAGGTYQSVTGVGEEWYVKKAKTKKHASNDVAASALYRAAGLDVPQVHHASDAPGLGGGFQSASQIVPGATKDLSSKLSDADYKKQVQKGFAVDAWLANWDVAGLGFDNIVTGADGKPHRIDTGGALLYRAQGVPKGAAFGPTVTELDTLRDPYTNAQSAKLFGDMSDDDIRESAKLVQNITPTQIDQIVKESGLPSSVADTLKERRQFIIDKYSLGDTTPVIDELTPELEPGEPSFGKSVFADPPDDIDWEGIGESIKNGEFAPDTVIAKDQYGHDIIVAPNGVDVALYDADGEFVDAVDGDDVDILVNVGTGWKLTDSEPPSTGDLADADPGFTLDSNPGDPGSLSSPPPPPSDGIDFMENPWAPSNTVEIWEQPGGAKAYVTSNGEIWYLTPGSPPAIKTTWNKGNIETFNFVKQLGGDAPSATPTPPVHGSQLPYGVQLKAKQWMKSENLGYWSKPEKIWGVLEALQVAHPDPANSGHSKYTKLQLLEALDSQLKTSKPNPYQEKVNKWLATPAGKSHSLTPAATGIAIPAPTDFGVPVSAKTVGKKVGKSAKVSKKAAAGIELDNAAKAIGALDPQSIEGISNPKQQQIFTEFKGLPATYLSSPDAQVYGHMKTMAEKYKMSVLQIAQIIDVQGAKKAGVANSKLFEAKLLKFAKSKQGQFIVQGKVPPAPATPSLGVSSTGVPNTPELKFKGTIPSKAESNKYSYKVISNAKAIDYQRRAEMEHGTISTTEKSGLRHFTGNSYTSINAYLRGETSTTSPQNLKKIIDAQSGMRPSLEPMLLHRGVALSGFGVTHPSQLQALIGKTGSHKGFSSTSVGGSAAFSMKPIIMEIEAPPGTPMAFVDPYSINKGENEMLLAAGLRYEILSVEEKKGSYKTQHVVRVRIVP